MLARLDIQPLESAVEIVDDAGVVAVDEDLGFLGFTSRRTDASGSACDSRSRTAASNRILIAEPRVGEEEGIVDGE